MSGGDFANPARHRFTFTPDLLAALRCEGVAAEMVDMLAARGTIDLDSLMEEVDRGVLALSDAVGMHMTAAYFAAQDRAFNEYFGDLNNWRPTPPPSPEREEKETQ